jgi:hypothetical protein
MPLGVPVKENAHQSKSLRQQEQAARRGYGGKFEDRLNLFSRYMKLLDDFLYARTRLKIFKNRSHGHPGTAKHPCAAASVRHAFDGGTLGPIESCHVLTLLSP